MNKEEKESVALMSILALAWGGRGRLRGNPPSPDESHINPPQTEEYKYYYLARAEAKRNRRKEARLYRKKWNIK